MKKILAVSVHPNLSGANTKGDIKKSFASNVILDELAIHPQVTIHKLLIEYPDYKIDVLREQELLKSHDLIMLIGPIYWYSLPAIAKLWIDDVLLYGWAYGSSGKELKNKEIQIVLTSGSEINEYCAEEIGSTLDELFVPFRRSFEYCNMIWRPIQFMGGLSNQHINNQPTVLTNKIKSFVKQLLAQV